MKKCYRGASKASLLKDSAEINAFINQNYFTSTYGGLVAALAIALKYCDKDEIEHSIKGCQIQDLHDQVKFRSAFLVNVCIFPNLREKFPHLIT